ncbi:MAG TPA: hypothetical protein VGX23_33730 [Actinocrinis sp.]|nr:hypothetical protein [Actinocrinis sp.]
MAAEQTVAPVSLDQQLATARDLAAEKRRTLDGLTIALEAAVREQRFADAEQAKQAIPAAEQDWGTAEATSRALAGVLADLAAQAAQRAVAEQTELRRQQATANLNAAVERERQLLDELMSTRAELVAGVGAVQSTIQRAYEIEGAVRQARGAQAQARVDSGEAAAMPGHISAPNAVSAFVDRSPALLAILRGTALPS